MNLSLSINIVPARLPQIFLALFSILLIMLSMLMGMGLVADLVPLWRLLSMLGIFAAITLVWFFYLRSRKTYLLECDRKGHIWLSDPSNPKIQRMLAELLPASSLGSSMMIWHLRTAVMPKVVLILIAGDNVRADDFRQLSVVARSRLQ